MKKTTLIFWIAFIFGLLMPLGSAEIDLGTYKQGECLELYQYCTSCTYANVTMLEYPNGTMFSGLQWSMEENGLDYNYTFCDTEQLGTYSFAVRGDKSGTESQEKGSFEITSTGHGNIESGQGSIILIGIITILVISIFFFVMGFKSNNIIFAVIFFTVSGTFILITSLFSMVLFDNLLANYSNVVEGYSTFIVVIKTIFTIGMLSLVIYSGLVALKLWKIKRGFVD